ncbi:MAG: hypothetical protein JO004_03075, partial [Methylobacteriaceae bacterium]|nr:hypothetical protein [Methylobacteriaceae bacterium]
RYVRSEQGFETLIHADRREGSDVVVVTDLAVLKALQKGRLSVSAAVERKLLIPESDGDTEAVASLLNAAYEDAAATATDLATRLPWRRSHLR